jgi:hypothetical protein
MELMLSGLLQRRRRRDKQTPDHLVASVLSPLPRPKPFAVHGLEDMVWHLEKAGARTGSWNDLMREIARRCSAPLPFYGATHGNCPFYAWTGLTVARELDPPKAYTQQ